eukprot:CAMPEP_0194398438 /NCGR_PEP_ID=MMETSP0174-20130528/126100_1 /TAXON_ID=216777 /ORGANISM="Proboscia alata, Strain PI-D3" /LENGTH=444 /DNA_ID=CAMNT_0039194729 /DNA_START=182 /DNA_END=1519 /DNA_ORIENTATION=-
MPVDELLTTVDEFQKQQNQAQFNHNEDPSLCPSSNQHPLPRPPPQNRSRRNADTFKKRKLLKAGKELIPIINDIEDIFRDSTSTTSLTDAAESSYMDIDRPPPQNRSRRNADTFKKRKLLKAGKELIPIINDIEDIFRDSTSTTSLTDAAESSYMDIDVGSSSKTTNFPICAENSDGSIGNHISAVVITLGSSIMTPKEQYIIHFPSSWSVDKFSNNQQHQLSSLLLLTDSTNNRKRYENEIARRCVREIICSGSNNNIFSIPSKTAHSYQVRIAILATRNSVDKLFQYTTASMQQEPLVVSKIAAHVPDQRQHLHLSQRLVVKQNYSLLRRQRRPQLPPYAALPNPSQEATKTISRSSSFKTKTKKPRRPYTVVLDVVSSSLLAATNSIIHNTRSASSHSLAKNNLIKNEQPPSTPLSSETTATNNNDNDVWMIIRSTMKGFR